MKIDRNRIHSKYNGKCAYCGEGITVKQMQIDHIHPKAHGGTDEEENLRPSCRLCNYYKSTMTIEMLRKELSLQLDRLQKNTNFRLCKKYGQIQETQKEITFYFETF